MKKLATVIALSLMGLMPVSNGSPDLNEADRPNIILFIVDDMGWQDTSVPFHSVRTPFNALYRTPNMERLARQGLLFTQAYAASPVCTPTRSSIMTGRNPARTHITNWTLRNSREAQETGPKHYPLQSPAWDFDGLQPDDVLLPKLLSDGGYHTIHVGKAHFGAPDTPGADPLTLGFEVNIAGHAAGGPGSFYGMHDFSAAHRGGGRIWDVPGLEAYHGRDVYLTEALTIEANKAIASAVGGEAPFYMNMAHYTVHAPIMADSQYVDHYSDQDPKEAAYASMVQGMDASLGAILHQLEALGEATKTLIIFASDNGGLSAHARGTTMMGTGLNSHNLPLRSGKGSAYEGGIRIPLMISWARVDPYDPMQQAITIPRGLRTDTQVITEDLFPTILHFAQAKAPPNYVIDGHNLVPLLQNKERVLGWHYPHKWGPEGPGLDPFTAVRKGDWKLIYFYKDRRFELYNLANDIGETTDLFWKNPEQAAEMTEVMHTWMEEMDAQVPEDRATGNPVPFP